MDVMQIAGAVGVLGGAAGVAVWAARGLWRGARRLGHALDDVLGEPERPGVPERPGLIARLAAIEAEMRPNHGSSLRDALDATRDTVARVEERLDEHLAEHRANQGTSVR